MGTSDEFALQKQDYRTLKSGTAKLLEAGRRHVATLRDHGLSSREVVDQVGAEVLRAEAEAASRAVKATGPTLLEWCCSGT
eukprot:775805-Lingulodinium_polyedra.AAC.1